MAHAPALLRTNTAPVFSAERRLGSISGASGIAGPRASALSGSTVYASASNPSLASMSTLVGSDSGPVMATANIINQKADASRSLYQICFALKQRLHLVPDFEQYQNELNELTLKSEGGPVDALWNLLRTGLPLLTVFNSLQPEKPLSVDGVAGNPAKVSKIAVFRFVEACLQQLNMKSGECFVINDLMGNDTTGFVKVIQVVNHVLDIAQSQGKLSEPLEVLSTEVAGAGAPVSKMSYRDHVIKEMVDTERKYVQDLENLHDLKKALEQQGIIPGDVVHDIFLNINSILDFQRRFLIKVETTNSMAQDAQHWGAPFAAFENSFNIYQPFIANQRKAAQIAGQVFEKIQVIQHPVACDFNTLDGFLLKPMQRLVKYPLLLKDLLKKTEEPAIKKDLSEGIAAAERVLSQANEAVNLDLLDEAVEDLKKRVDDWKNHRLEHFGRLLLHGVHTVITGRSEQEKDYEIYLFESILLCCKEMQPNKSKDKKDKTKSNIPKIRNKNNKLQLKGRIFMTNVTEVLSFAKPGSYTVQIWWKGDPGVENFIIKFTNEEQMKKWAGGLDNQRKLNVPSSIVAPVEKATDFAWMKNAQDLENPYAQQEESDDDEETPVPTNMLTSPSAGFGAPQQSTGGVMARNASSTSLRTRSATGESTQSLAGIARAPPPRFPLPPPPNQLSLQTHGVPQGASSPGPRGGDSYFSPATESPVSTRTSTASSMQFSSGYPFPKTGTPQGWEDPTLATGNRYTAPAMPRAPSRDGSSPVNTYTINGRNPRGPSMPVMASQQSAAQQQRNRSYSTPDINGQINGHRSNTSTPVPAVPGIPAHLHDANIPRSQNGSPMQEVPIRTSTQSPGYRMHQSHGSLGGQMGQFPAKPLYPGRSTPGPGPQAGVPPPLQLDNHSAVSPALGTASNPLFSPAPDSMPTQLKVKVNCDSGNYITLVVAFNITFQSMIDRIDAKLSRFTDSSIGKGGLRLRYRDEDDDFVSIESDEDIQIAFLEHRDGAKNQYNLGGVGEIELFCVGDM
ncbi:Pleckstrin homology domain-containing protein [Truncatella angustata]|uniref:Pleckstrin homology domain-containing protein n=1 Tax=Truncatella angustata TaxID=152316 RepID=A0A9P8URF7_9PEZI|nr:Pleckstrin homology domain-containing protein [Truncatella angustata]KAH6657625.1 Pleckstrin homology domain-containing protein [Truncatella angustata]